MSSRINKITEDLGEKLIKYRRDFHKYAETAWTEFRTASLVARYLADLGYKVETGRDVIDKESRMGVPPDKVLKKHFQRAKEQGADLEFLDSFQGGYTGVVGTLKNGQGPTLAFRFDMDAVEMEEKNSDGHFPSEEGFVSVNDNAMHACGHDGHTSIGLGLAEVLMNLKDDFSGTIKLIFQPAEEGVRGARSMMEAGVVKGVDYLFGLHLGLSADGSGVLFPGTKGFLATSKFDAYFKGKPAHAGAQPEEGKNALQAAAAAVNNLYAISRHSQGVTRINVGKMEAGTGRNVIPDRAKLVIETRGHTSKLNNYMYDRACQVLESSAQMYGVDLNVEPMGGAESGKSDLSLANRVQEVAEKIDDFIQVKEKFPDLGGSEDFTYFMKRVQENGGQVSFIMLGTELEGSHHTAEFDFNEEDLRRGVKLLANLVMDITK